MTALVNLATKSVATESGIAFTAVFFTIFAVSETRNAAKHQLTQQQMKEHFQLEQQDTIGREELQVRPGSVLVTMRDPRESVRPQVGAGTHPHRSAGHCGAHRSNDGRRWS